MGKKAIKVHGDKYNYSKVEYIHSQKKVIIICKLHGEFEQKAVDHLSGNGCNKCGKRHTLEIFLERAKKIHGDRYSYEKSQYIRLRDDIIITCKTHGDFTTKAGIHLRGFNCPKCSDTDIDSLINKANLIHKNKYSYEKHSFNKMINKISIFCPIHGNFYQRAESHIKGQGCPKCARGLNLHRKTDWIKKYKNKSVSLYILECFNSQEKFYKIGITGNIKTRYDSKRKLPYEFKIILEIKSKNVEFIWQLEKDLLKHNYKYRYTPKIKFGGSKYECFNKYELIGNCANIQ